MAESLAVPDDGRNPISQKDLCLDPIHHLARCMTAEQMERGRRLGCLRSQHARLLRQVEKLLQNLNRITHDLNQYSLGTGSTGGLLPNQYHLSTGSTGPVVPVVLVGSDSTDILSSSLSSSSPREEKTKRIPSLSGRSSPHAHARVNVEPDYSPDFQAFWALWPKKVKKPEAYHAWSAIRIQNGLYETILDAVKLQTQYTWHGKSKTYIPNPATWLNGRQWEDEILTPALPPAMQAAADYIRDELEKELHEQG